MAASATPAPTDLTNITGCVLVINDMSMKISSLRYLPFIVLIATGLFVATTGARTPRKQPLDPDRIKAEYIFMEANSRLQQNELGTAYYMMRRAAQLDPTDPDIAGALAELTIFSGIGDSIEFEKAYEDMRRRYLANPKDFQNGLRFVRVATQLHRETDIRDTYKMLSEAYPNRSEYALQYAVARAFDYMRGDTAATTEAIAILNRIEQGIGLDPTLILNKLQVYMIKSDTAAMIREVRRYASTAPDDAEVNFITGQLFNNISMPDSAIIYYDKACAIDSTLGAAYMARAEHYLANGDSARYDSEVVKVLESPSIEFPPKLEILTNYTRALYQNTERHGSVNEVFERMLDIHSGEPQLRHLYAAYLAAIDSNAQAAEQFGYAMDLDPNNADYPRFRIHTAIEAGDTAQAITTAKEAGKRFHDITLAISGATLLALQEKPKEALEMLDSFKIEGTEQPKAVSLYYQQRGDILYKLEEVDSALASYENSLKFDPDNAGALNNLAYFMAEGNRDIDKAESYIRRALASEPMNPTYIDTHAWVLFKKKDYEGARREIDEVLKIYTPEEILPDIVTDTAVFNALVAADKASADTIDTVVPVEDEIEAETPSSEIYDHAGDIYFMTGEKEKAIEFWKEALALDPENKRIKQKIKNRRINDKK